MSEELFFAVKTISLSTRMKRKPQTLLHAAKHNLREDQKERGSRSHIDPARSHLNRRIAGPALSADVVALALGRMAGAGYKALRRDYTQAYELLFSLPASTSVKPDVYFEQCLRWATAQFDQDNILCADIHHDEPAPHLHILVMPMIGGRYMGSKLIERVRLASLRDSFAEMALSFGLKEPTRRLHGAMKEVAARMVLSHLETTQDAILQSALWFTARQDIERDPARYVAALGLELPARAAPVKKIKTLEELVVSKGKGPRYERADKPIGFDGSAVVKPIGFECGPSGERENIETIPVLVCAQEPSAFRSTAVELPEIEAERDAEDGYALDAVRVRENDLDANLFDPMTGEYFQRPPAPTRHRRQAADEWAAAAVINRQVRQTISFSVEG